MKILLFLTVFDYSSGKSMSRVYAWGRACYGALGVPHYVRSKSNKQVRFDSMHR